LTNTSMNELAAASIVAEAGAIEGAATGSAIPACHAQWPHRLLLPVAERRIEKLDVRPSPHPGRR